MSDDRPDADGEDRPNADDRENGNEYSRNGGADGGTDAEATPDLDELREHLEALAAANAAIRAYGETHDVPVFEFSAKRIDGTIATLRQNVPGALTDFEEMEPGERDDEKRDTEE
ncbi:hypothetical protein BRD01_03735 [Halobacteriales archaeon QS_8_65_32]|jgi:hypothetical protein|nr:MAG: hypothetical protein BRD01_03735 [Halobacteriales archaeon QS_8_65_32]